MTDERDDPIPEGEDIGDDLVPKEDDPTIQHEAPEEP